MPITNIIFICWFLPISLAVYYMVRDEAKEYVLLAVSIVFYACGSPSFLALFIFSIVITVLIGRVISRLREHRMAAVILLICGIIYHVLILGYYKYFNFVFSIWGSVSNSDVSLKELVLPMGISFFTFKAISYLADIYMNKVEMGGGIFHDALYLSLFSQIQSGPLTRYGDMSRARICCDGKFGGLDFFGRGVNRFIVGLCKKMLLANTLSNITTEVFSTDLTVVSTLYVWLGSVCYSLQLYYDFAGYSDMAIGISEMFGYTCTENFNYPYMTESISQFWRRWHITLGAWFRDYVYIPLGGSRNKHKWRLYFNLLVVWVLTGIWHGASWNFVFWGLGYFILTSAEKLTGFPERFKFGVSKMIYRIVALLLINFQWVIFRMESLSDGLQVIKRMLMYSENPLMTSRVMFLLSDYGWAIAAAVLFCFPVVPWIEKRTSHNHVLYRIYECGVAVGMTLLFFWAVSFIIAGRNNPFVYVNF